jgi:hypothetical protein
MGFMINNAKPARFRVYTSLTIVHRVTHAETSTDRFCDAFRYVEYRLRLRRAPLPSSGSSSHPDGG